MTVPAALPDLQRIEAYAVPLEAQRRCRALERLAVRDTLVDRHLAEPERPLVRPVQVEVARHQTLHRIFVQLERVTKVGERPAIEPDARVDLLSLILARIAEGELAIGANLRLRRTSGSAFATIA